MRKVGRIHTQVKDNKKSSQTLLGLKRQFQLEKQAQDKRSLNPKLRSY